MKPWMWIALALAAAGCTGNSPLPEAGSTTAGPTTYTAPAPDEALPVASIDGPRPASQTAPAAEAAVTEGDVSVQILSWEQTQELVAKQRGKVVVLDVWSTSCIPCMKEFPNLVKLDRQFGDKIACVSLNCDYLGIGGKPAEYYRDQVLTFLTKREATFQNVMSSHPADELHMILDLAAIPAVYVYDQQGQLRTRFDNDSNEYGVDGFSYEQHIIPLVESLIGEERTAAR